MSLTCVEIVRVNSEFELMAIDKKNLFNNGGHVRFEN